MMEAVIQADRLGKQYRIGREPEGYRTLRDTLANAAIRSIRAIRPLVAGGAGSQASSRTFWALRDVSFEVRRGEVVGIIGRNGAGKTTLLRILSRITEPNLGCAEIRGRVASLLEVGTGFHPELTGRENIQLNGAILGMRKREIDRRFDEIVAFAGVDDFIDTPLKHYSTGMQMRLAFSIAAHLEPEILVVDEVLAVGDSEFQRKCIGAMEAVSQGGRTILLVSHQMNQIRRLCRRAIWLDEGRLRSLGPTASVVAAYETELSRSPAPGISDDPAGVSFLKWEITSPSGAPSHTLRSPGPVRFALWVAVHRRIAKGEYGITLYDGQHRSIWSVSRDGLQLEPGTYRFAHALADLPVRPGVYFWQAGLYDGDRWIVWRAQPELVIATAPKSHHRLDEYAGILNIDADVDICPAERSSATRQGTCQETLMSPQEPMPERTHPEETAPGGKPGWTADNPQIAV